MYEAIVYKGQVYVSNETLAKAFCLKESTVDELIMKNDLNGEVREKNGIMLVPRKVFSRIHFPQDTAFFHIAFAFSQKKAELARRELNG